MSKIISMEKAAKLISDGNTVAFGGNVLHRAPMEFVRELVRQNKRYLNVVKTAGAMEVDMLCLGGCACTVNAGFISYESEFGLANNYRVAVQKGLVKANEHACYTVICALRAASMGVGFMPVKGLVNSQLIDCNPYFSTVTDPFTGDRVTVVEAIRPDYGIIHVHKADSRGNCYIAGPKYDDILLAKASKNVIVTAEEIVPDGYFTGETKSDLPFFSVTAVVEAKQGALPCSCSGLYDIDRDYIKSFTKLKSQEELQQFLNTKGGGGHN